MFVFFLPVLLTSLLGWPSLNCLQSMAQPSFLRLKASRTSPNWVFTTVDGCEIHFAPPQNPGVMIPLQIPTNKGFS